MLLRFMHDNLNVNKASIVCKTGEAFQAHFFRSDSVACSINAGFSFFEVVGTIFLKNLAELKEVIMQEDHDGVGRDNVLRFCSSLKICENGNINSSYHILRAFGTEGSIVLVANNCPFLLTTFLVK